MTTTKWGTEMKTSELQGAALDWAVATADGYEDYPISDVGQYEMSVHDLREVQLWYAVGLGGVYYGTKEQCEKEVRKAYPDESPDKRYARVFCKTFYEEV